MKILAVPYLLAFTGLLNSGVVERLYNASSKNEAVSFIANEKIIQDTIVAPGAIPQLISSQFSFTEGPAVDKAGNVFFTDQPNNKIWKYGTDGTLAVFLEKAGRSNGLYFDRKGNLLACADEKSELWRISPTKKISVLVKDIAGKRLNGPNDLWVHPNGTIYFTDPYYQRPYWTRTNPDIKEERVYFLKKGRSKIIVATEGLVKPNGIVGTADGKKYLCS